MMLFLQENLPTILVGAVVAAMLLGAVWYLCHQRKKASGAGGCGGSCCGCPCAAKCPEQR